MMVSRSWVLRTDSDQPRKRGLLKSALESLMSGRSMAVGSAVRVWSFFREIYSYRVVQAESSYDIMQKRKIMESSYMASCKKRIIGVMVFVISWYLMNVSPLTMGVNVVAVAAAASKIWCSALGIPWFWWTSLV